MSSDASTPSEIPPNSGASLESEHIEPQPQLGRRRVWLPLILFVATCVSTYVTGGWDGREFKWTRGLAFSMALMVTLTAHELGHFVQARRYRVPASLPYFIPMPANPIGTMGAVIFMHPRMGHRKALFDIAITGPLAGLVPALAFTLIGLRLSSVDEIADNEPALMLGEPVLFRLMAYLTFGPLPEGKDIMLDPIGFAGWVGIFITALNLIPIGQLDGGHILYALLRTKAHPLSRGLLFAAAVSVVLSGYWGWSLMILLLLLMGPVHPPTSDDQMPLGRGRMILGWITLLFVFVGFTPTPFFVR